MLTYIPAVTFRVASLPKLFFPIKHKYKCYCVKGIIKSVISAEVYRSGMSRNVVNY